MNTACQVCDRARATALHHIRLRHHFAKGDPARDAPANLLPVCAPCHTYIHDHVDWALEHGYLKGPA